MPVQLAPDGGIDAPDLRAFLLKKLASQPARLKQDHCLYQKERERFEQALPQLPRFLTDVPELQRDRIDRAHHSSRYLKFVRVVSGGGDIPGMTEVTRTGQQWLSIASMPSTPRCTRNSASRPVTSGWATTITISSAAASPSVPARSDGYGHWYQPGDSKYLRDTVRQALSSLPVGQFFALDELAKSLSRGPGNPLYLNRKMGQVVVRQPQGTVLPLEEVIEDLGAELLRDFFLRRLVPLGARRGRDRRPGPTPGGSPAALRAVLRRAARRGETRCRRGISRRHPAGLHDRRHRHELSGHRRRS